jgi:hypothetical protein
MIRTYGDSFSFRHWISEEETYTARFAKEIKIDYVNRSSPGICNDEIFQRFTEDLHLFEKGDIIIYQFSQAHRVGTKFHETGAYYSTASLVPDIDECMQIIDGYGGYEKIPLKEKDLLILAEYAKTFGKWIAFYQWHRVNNILEFLRKEKGIKYIYLAMTNEFSDFYSDRNVLFPIKENSSNLSMNEWVISNGLDLHNYTDKVKKPDSHPCPEGHGLIAEKVKLLYHTIVN